MGIRTPKEMKMHDTIIRSMAGIYEQKGAHKVSTNLDKQEAVINGVEVDLIIKNPLQLVFKVETESTVTEGSAIAWKQIFDKAGIFYLMVPEPLTDEAYRISKEAKVNLRLCTYRVKDNKLVFGRLP